MIRFAHGVNVFICTAPADMRRSFDGLGSMAEHLMKQDPLGGAGAFSGKAENKTQQAGPPGHWP